MGKSKSVCGISVGSVFLSLNSKLKKLKEAKDIIFRIVTEPKKGSEKLHKMVIQKTIDEGWVCGRKEIDGDSLKLRE